MYVDLLWCMVLGIEWVFASNGMYLYLIMHRSLCVGLSICWAYGHLLALMKEQGMNLYDGSEGSHIE